MLNQPGQCRPNSVACTAMSVEHYLCQLLLTGVPNLDRNFESDSSWASAVRSTVEHIVLSRCKAWGPYYSGRIFTRWKTTSPIGCYSEKLVGRNCKGMHRWVINRSGFGTQCCHKVQSDQICGAWDLGSASFEKLPRVGRLGICWSAPTIINHLGSVTRAYVSWVRQSLWANAGGATARKWCSAVFRFETLTDMVQRPKPRLHKTEFQVVELIWPIG